MLFAEISRKHLVILLSLLAYLKIDIGQRAPFFISCLKIILSLKRLKLLSPKSRLLIVLYFSQLEPFLFCSYLMEQGFQPAINKSSKFILLKHAYTTRLKSSKHAKMSATMLSVVFFILFLC
jgi:hypothetical protein